MINADYVCGFVDGEGCFYILNTNRIACEFQVSQKEKNILEEIKKFFGCGYVKAKYDKANTFVYIVKDIDSLYNIILPFFNHNKLQVKDNQFKQFEKVVKLIRFKKHLTAEGKAKVNQIKSGSSETIRFLTKN